MDAFVSPVPLARILHPCQLNRRSLCMSSKKDADDKQPDPKTSTSPLDKPAALGLTRRDLLRLVSGSGFAFTAYLTYQWREQFRYLSPNGVLNTVFSSRQPLRASAATSDKPVDWDAFIAKQDAGSDLTCPDFPAGADWINSGRLSLTRELSGKVVLLDFFTYCCINCMHVLPQLAALERTHAPDGSKGFAVVGVHSAKFSAERETANIAAAVARLGIGHPVLNDERMALWGALGVTSWPTIALLGPRGNLLAVWTGEPPSADVAGVVDAALRFYKPSLNRKPLPPAPAASALARSTKSSVLRYPGKLVAGAGGVLYVSDSANHQVLEVGSTDGRVLRSLGDGEPGLVDGKRPRFRDPQGLAVSSDGTQLYVCDTGNHCVRAVDLRSGQVSTLGGTGAQGFDYHGGKVGAQQALSSPWALDLAGQTLVVAMAGTHQLWTLNVSQPGSKWAVFSGTGRELEKNASAAHAASWAQPSGLSVGVDTLYVADSESSTVRTVSLSEGMNPTRTLAGGDGVIAENLFAFGDRDGRGAKAKFQHPLAVLADDRRGVVYVADSYNHKIKTVDTNGVARTFCGKGKPGFADGVGGSAEFWEPSGLAMSADGQTIFVADTNNSAIRVIDIDSKGVSTLDVVEGDGTAVKQEQRPLIGNRRRATVTEAGESVGKQSVISVVVELPTGTHFTPGTTSRFQGSVVRSQGGENSYSIVESGAASSDEKTNSCTFKVDLGKAKSAPNADDSIEVESVVYYCGDDDGVCRSDPHVFQFGVAKGGSNQEVPLRRSIPLPKKTKAVAAKQ